MGAAKRWVVEKLGAHVHGRTVSAPPSVISRLGNAEIQMQVQMWSSAYETPLPNGSGN